MKLTSEISAAGWSEGKRQRCFCEFSSKHPIPSQFFPSAQYFPALILLWRVKKAKHRRHRLSLGWCASARSAEQKDTDLRIQPPGLLSILQVQSRAPEEQLMQAATPAHASDADLGAEHVPLEGRAY